MLKKINNIKINKIKQCQRDADGEENKMKLIKNILALTLAIISINACSSSENPNGEKDNLLKSDLMSSGELTVENQADALVIKQTDNTDDSYITSVKTGNNEYTIIVKSESQNSEISMVYENKSLFPTKATFKSKRQILSGDITNYNEAEKTFDISWKEEDGTEILAFSGVKLNNEIDFSKYESLDEETYQLKIMVNTSVISDSIDEYVAENPMPRGKRWDTFIKIVKIIIKVLAAIFS